MIPLLKWAGGKRKLAPAIIELIGNDYNHYYEPFVGGASMLLHLLPEHASCFDINRELINFYLVVKDNPERLIFHLTHYFIPNHNKQGDAFYYFVRNWDRVADTYMRLSPERRAARFLYLNKACYNGLWRENQFGQNNVPSGHHTVLSLPTKEHIMEVSAYLREHDVQFYNNDYLHVEFIAQPGDLVYFDPPYDIEAGQNGFVSYSSGGFNRICQMQLKGLCDRLVLSGVKVAVSNSNTEFIRNLYGNPEDGGVEYEIHQIDANRSLGSDPTSRKTIKELIIIGRP